MEQSRLAQAPFLFEVYIKGSLWRKMGPTELEDRLHLYCFNYNKQNA